MQQDCMHFKIKVEDSNQFWPSVSKFKKMLRFETEPTGDFILFPILIIIFVVLEIEARQVNLHTRQSALALSHTPRPLLGI
jgi:hypothetical protein